MEENKKRHRAPQFRPSSHADEGRPELVKVSVIFPFKKDLSFLFVYV